MKWRITQALLLGSVVAVLLLTGCLKDKCAKTYKLRTPVYTSVSKLVAERSSGSARSLVAPGKIYVYGNYIFLNEEQKGVHVIDNSNPAAPKNISFIGVPGNIDIAVKGNTLYADSYGNLATIDITDPAKAVIRNYLPNVFYYDGYYTRGSNASNPDSIFIVTDWTEKDTTVSCEVYQGPIAYYDAVTGLYSSTPGGGTGGSMARFTLAANHLYSVTSNKLSTFNLDDPQKPTLAATNTIDYSIETIYPFNNKLFIGSSNGMYIYDIGNASNPTRLGSFSHVRSCDPVIADNQYAWVTLRGGTSCGGYTNQLEVMDISTITDPKLLKIYPMNNPHGLSKDGNLLFICDGTEGLKILDAADVNDVKQLKQIGGIETYDVIAYNKKAIVVAKDGLYQFDYSNTADIKLLSVIPVKY